MREKLTVIPNLSLNIFNLVALLCMENIKTQSSLIYIIWGDNTTDNTLHGNHHPL